MRSVALALALTPCLASAAAPAIDRARAEALLFPGEAPPTPCDVGGEAEQVACLIGARYAHDARAAKVAVAMYRATGSVPGLLPEQDFDGGYRGLLHLVPRLPVGAQRRHLDMVAVALADFDDFFARLGGASSYRWRALELRFFESVGRRTPSAWARGWTVAYNLRGSLFGSEAGVRGTLFHEVFHLNDQARGNWTWRALSDIYDRILNRCGADTKCLEPYAPDSLKVKGGTYYAFHAGNGVEEYGADLARRYYLEHRALLRKQKALAPFKCRTAWNAEAWRKLVDEFFGGVDLVPPCR